MTHAIYAYTDVRLKGEKQEKTMKKTFERHTNGGGSGGITKQKPENGGGSGCVEPTDRKRY